MLSLIKDGAETLVNVTYWNEMFREGFETVTNVAFWNVMLGCSLNGVTQWFLSDGAGCWRRFSRGPQLRLRRLIQPSGFPHVVVGRVTPDIRLVPGYPACFPCIIGHPAR